MKLLTLNIKLSSEQSKPTPNECLSTRNLPTNRTEKAQISESIFRRHQLFIALSTNTNTNTNRMEEESRREARSRERVRTLLEKATNSTAGEVDLRLLKAIKSVVRYSDSELRIAAHTLMDLMKRDHSQVRFLSLLIIDELFMRSKLFRTLVVENLDRLLTLSVGFRRNVPLPAPPAVASVLRSKAIEFLEKWNVTYGIHYRQLRLGYDYLKNTLRFQFPNIQQNAARVQQERREREMRTKEILRNKFEALKESFSSVKEEIQSTVEEITECLDILCTREDNVPLGPLDDEDIEDVRSSELLQIRIHSLKEGKKVQENNDNKVLFDALRELYKLLVSKHLVTLQESISILIRVEVEDNRLRDSILKEIIDIRNHLQSVKKKCEQSGCVVLKTENDDRDEEEDFWEEGKIESLEAESSSANKKNEDLPSTAKQLQTKAARSNNRTSDIYECGDTDLPLKHKLLAEAPVMEWDPCLTNWGSKRDVLANQRGLEVENHWGRVDQDAVIPADKIAELNMKASIYKEKPKEIQPCRAPLSKSGLCQRRDLKVCPFHGPIIPRDEEGKPLVQNPPENEICLNSSEDEKYFDLGSELVENLATRAVENVRYRDKEDAKKRKSDKKALNRAKLAKVREHNEAVLRDAALVSTSRSAAVGEDMDAASEGEPSSRNKKQTLTSMLRKKETSKDRLARRLLNSRVRGAAVKQQTSGEDDKYREAFPNQW